MNGEKKKSTLWFTRTKFPKSQSPKISAEGGGGNQENQNRDIQRTDGEPQAREGRETQSPELTGLGTFFFVF